jgi:hypothetical protein
MRHTFTSGISSRKIILHFDKSSFCNIEMSGRGRNVETKALLFGKCVTAKQGDSVVMSILRKKFMYNKMDLLFCDSG